MINDNKIRRKLIKLLPKNYRQIVAKRARCHINTVYNVLHKEHDNEAVELAILTLAQEEKLKKNQHQEKADAIAKQL